MVEDEIKDVALIALCNNNPEVVNVNSNDITSNNEYNGLYDFREQLEYEGYIRIDKDVNKTWISLTLKGKAFIKSGGYRAQRKKKKKENKARYIDTIFNRGNVVIALSSLIVAYCALQCGKTNETTIAEQRKSIDSLSVKVNRLDSMISEANKSKSQIRR